MPWCLLEHVDSNHASTCMLASARGSADRQRGLYDTALLFLKLVLVWFKNPLSCCHLENNEVPKFNLFHLFCIFISKCI